MSALYDKYLRKLELYINETELEKNSLLIWSILCLEIEKLENKVQNF